VQKTSLFQHKKFERCVLCALLPSHISHKAEVKAKAIKVVSRIKAKA